MSEHSDGVDEALEATLRLALTVAGRMAERAAREREQAVRHAQTASEQEARELQSRLFAERSAARAALAPVETAAWWERADTTAIADAWQTAEQWKDLDPDIDRIRTRIADEVRDRYDVDVGDLQADPQAVREALVDRERQAGGLTATARLEHAEAARLVAAAANEREDRPTQAGEDAERAHALYDSAERREGLAARLQRAGVDPEAIEARVVADVNQARSASDAVLQAPDPPRARRGRSAPVATRGLSRRNERGR